MADLLGIYCRCQSHLAQTEERLPLRACCQSWFTAHQGADAKTIDKRLPQNTCKIHFQLCDCGQFLKHWSSLGRRHLWEAGSRREPLQAKDERATCPESHQEGWQGSSFTLQGKEAATWPCSEAFSPPPPLQIWESPQSPELSHPTNIPPLMPHPPFFFQFPGGGATTVGCLCSPVGCLCSPRLSPCRNPAALAKAASPARICFIRKWGERRGPSAHYLAPGSPSAHCSLALASFRGCSESG